MIGATLKQRARRVRSVTVADLEFTVTDAEGDWFPARLYPPRDADARQDGSPRDTAPRSRLVFHRDAPTLGPSDRVELHGDPATYELLTAPEPIRHGERVGGYEVEVLDTDVLYPNAGDIEDTGSAEAVPFSLYTGSEDVLGHGDYDTYEAEAPAEFAGTLGSNTVLVCGETRWRAISAVIDFQVPHVRLRLRGA